jgi:PAS domain S-box-containing protein
VADRLSPALERLERMLAGEQGLYPVDEVFRRVDGSPVDVEIMGSALMYKGRPGIQVIATDITERKKAEAERERLVTAIEQAAEGIVITDVAGAIQYVNPMFTRLSGYAREDVMGRNPRLLKSGAQDQAFYAGLWKTLLGGESWQGQVVNRRKNGTLYTVEMTISPVRNSSGAISNYVATMRDITHEIDLEQQILQAQRLESIGRLAGGVAHDFNNMLSVILGSVELAQLEMNEDHPAYADLREIEYAAKRSADLTRQLLAFARKQTVAPTAIDVNDTVEGMLKMLRRLIGEDVALEWAPGPEVGAIYIDPAQLDQVLANLCVNARDAMREGGRIVIETEKVLLDEAYCENHAGVAPGHFVALTVSDTGCGMEREVMERIFEPFFTMKAPGEGTGLGLSTVYGIVQQNGGFVHVYSEPGEGSTFKVYLPVHVGKGGAADTVEPGELPRGSGEVILVVEDEEPILVLAKRMLTPLGYKVLTASSPTECIEAARASPAPIDLLLSDVIMPGMNGRELDEALRKTCPGLRTLFMSGYTADVIAHRGVLHQGVNFMPKPFTLRTLATTVHRVLHGTP